MKTFSIVVLLVAAACGNAPTGVEVSRTVEQVIATQPIVGIGSHGNDNEAQQIDGLGMKHVRVTYYLENDSEHRRLLFRMRLQEMRARHIEALIVIHDFGDRSKAADTLASFARAFPGSLIQVGNEWDAWGYNGTQYAQLMKEVVPAVMRADSTAQLIGMGLATTDGQDWAYSPDDVRQANFTRDYLRAGGPMLTAWSIHAYGMNLDHAVTVRALATHAVLKGVMPLWITEVGADRDGIVKAWKQAATWSRAVIDSVQAVQSVNAVSAAARAGVARVYFYQLWTNDDDGFGFYRADAVTERPICASFRSKAWQQH